MPFKIELRCILVPLLIFEMFLQLEWIPPVVKELSIDRIVLRKGKKNKLKKSAALKVPKNTVASIILKWKKFGRELAAHSN